MSLYFSVYMRSFKRNQCIVKVWTKKRWVVFVSLMYCLLVTSVYFVAMVFLNNENRY